MAKFILALCLLIGLTGCSSAENIENRIEETVIKEENTVYKARINTVGDYFSYYLPFVSPDSFFTLYLYFTTEIFIVKH